MPQALKSEGKAIRIPKSSGHKCLRRSSRKGMPYEYQKAPGTNASGGQVGREGHTNTSKLKAQMPQAVKSKGKATRIPQSSGHKCLRRSSRKDRPNEYQKAPGANATKGQVEPVGKPSRTGGQNYFLATSATAMIISAIPSISQNPKRVWKRRKAKTMDDRGSKAAMMDASAGLI